MFSGQFYENYVTVRKRNIKLLLETVTYTATTERVTCIITIEIVVWIMHCKNTTCMTATETPTCIISIKIVAHIFAAETFTCINAAETFNCIIATETVTCIIAIEPRNLLNRNRRWDLHN